MKQEQARRVKIFAAFTDRGPNRVFIAMVLGAVAGLSYSLLIPIILNSIGSESQEALEIVNKVETLFSIEISNYKFAALFVCVCLVILVARTTSQVLLLRVSQEVTCQTRLKLYRRILKAPTDELEHHGNSKLLAVVTGDVNQIVAGAAAIPVLLVNGVTLAGLLSFLMYLNSEVFFYVVIGIVFGAITYQIPMYVAQNYFRKVRENVDVLYKSVVGLITGTKELKLNKSKRDNYYSEVLETAEADALRFKKKAETISKASGIYGELISFFVIGAITFIFVNYHAITKDHLIGVIMALLYITSPMGAVMGAVPDIIVARISLKRVNNFIDQMSTEDAVDEVKELPPWDTIRYKNLTYHYLDSDNNFALGPASIEIRKGDITFIVGGNGSGKSTLCKIVSLHYPPESGEIYFGETRVTRETINSCRETISAIFTDFYLFDRLLGSTDESDRNRIEQYLKDLNLEKKVTIVDGRFSTTSLSDGQKKRLALLVEFLEDKEMYIFDEWAADQDPVFKDVFYHQLLPDLKRRGKAVVCISHDDRYFDVADKVIVMDEGKVSQTLYPALDSEKPAFLTNVGIHSDTTTDLKQPEAVALDSDLLTDK